MKTRLLKPVSLAIAVVLLGSVAIFALRGQSGGSNQTGAAATVRQHGSQPVGDPGNTGIFLGEKPLTWRSKKDFRKLLHCPRQQVYCLRLLERLSL
jgi:hypothetical protein